MEDREKAIEPEIIEFGPYRAIGMSYTGKNEDGEIPELWQGENGFMSRMNEIDALEGQPMAFGICRCLSGATDGSFEYVAAIPAKPDSAIPDGMIEANVAAGTYAVFPVPSLSDLYIWNVASKWVEAQTEWEGYCNPLGNGNCDCFEHPAFELYPPSFPIDGKLFIYMPIHRIG